MTARMAPAEPPFPPEIQNRLDQLMKGRPPLRLFTVLARDPRLFLKFFSAGLLDRGHLSLRQREIVIHRTTSQCGAEYEWGVHAAVFASHAGLDAAQMRAIVHGDISAECWSEEDRVLMRMCDALHSTSTLGDSMWDALRAHFSEEAILELLMLAGFYRTVSYLANALRLPPEPGTPSFASVG